MTAWITEWGFYQRKDGKRGQPIVIAHYPYTELRQCELCGFLSTPKKVQVRNSCYVAEWHDQWETGTPHLCCGCWNKFRRIIAKRDALKLATKAINALKRAVVAARTHSRYSLGSNNP